MNEFICCFSSIKMGVGMVGTGVVVVEEEEEERIELSLLSSLSHPSSFDSASERPNPAVVVEVVEENVVVGAAGAAGAGCDGDNGVDGNVEEGEEDITLPILPVLTGGI